MTTNTHIAAHPKQLCMMAAAILDQPPGTMDNRHPYWPEAVKQAERAYAALQLAQALEAVPALDAQGEAERMAGSLFDHIKHGDADHQEWLRAQALVWSTRWLSAAPLPHAVGKPLSDEQIEVARSWLWANHCVSFSPSTIRELVGIVTKETGNG